MGTREAEKGKEQIQWQVYTRRALKRRVDYAFWVRRYVLNVRCIGLKEYRSSIHALNPFMRLSSYRFKLIMPLDKPRDMENTLWGRRKCHGAELHYSSI